MSLLIAVKSCQQHRDRHDAIRRTWGKDVFAPVRFFVGSGETPTSNPLQHDEILLEVPDDYNSLAQKTRAICRWATLEPSVGNLLLVDTDCCVYPENLARAPFHEFDYGGKLNGIDWEPYPRTLEVRLGEPPQNFPNCHPWFSGAGYFLSRKAFELVAREHNPEFYGYAEDVMVGQIIGSKKQELDLKRCKHRGERPYCKYFIKNGQSRGYDPNSGWMEETYAAR